MRKQKSGCILQISSVGGRLALPGSTAYHAAKWAVGGFTESLAQEVAPFGVRVCTLEPGGMRTNWNTRAQAILRLAASDRLPAHLLLGSDAVKYAAEAEAARAAEAERWREISVSTDFRGPRALPDLQF